ESTKPRKAYRASSERNRSSIFPKSRILSGKRTSSSQVSFFDERSKVIRRKYDTARDASQLDPSVLGKNGKKLVSKNGASRITLLPSLRALNVCIMHLSGPLNQRRSLTSPSLGNIPM